MLSNLLSDEESVECTFCSVNNAPVGKNSNYPTMASYKRIKKLTALFVLFAIVCVFCFFFLSNGRHHTTIKMVTFALYVITVFSVLCNLWL